MHLIFSNIFLNIFLKNIFLIIFLMGSLKVRPCSAGYKLCMSCPIKKLPFCIFCPDQIMGEVLTQTSYAVQNFSAPVGGALQILPPNGQWNGVSTLTFHL
jgi:hypothetical protein